MTILSGIERILHLKEYIELSINECLNECLCPETGLTYKRLGRLEEALDCFHKLHAILRNSAQVMYQLASLYPSLLDASYNLWNMFFL